MVFLSQTDSFISTTECFCQLCTKCYNDYNVWGGGTLYVKEHSIDEDCVNYLIVILGRTPPVSFQHLPPCTLGRHRGVSEREVGENCEGERMWLQSQERRGMCIAQSRLCTFSKVLRKPNDCLCSPFLNPSLSAVIWSEVMYSRSCDGITVKQWVGTVSVFS